MQCYETRKQLILEGLASKGIVLQNKVRFINMVNDESLTIFRKKKAVIESELRKLKFDTIDSKYDYLLDLKISSLTLEIASEFAKQLEDNKKTAKKLEAKNWVQFWEEDLS